MSAIETVAALARICLVVLFPFSALDKIVHWSDAKKQAESSFLPLGAPLVIAAIAVEIVTPICIVFGWYPHIAALVLAAYCVATAVLYHPFWNFSDFWSSRDSEGNRHLWDFLKNFGLVGGLLLIVIYT
ncbi:MAG: DoxX family protein [Betaproteobacteria bacterium]